jgi:LacI family transcriptional regulator
MAATIRDVARAAGVSVATVSRVLNDSGPVRIETRQRIMDAAQTLHFSPNSTARSLSIRQTHTIGVLLPDLYGEFFSEIIRGIDQTVQANGFHALISSSHNAAGEVEAAMRTMRGRVDGLILMASGLDAALLAPMLPERTPIVMVNANYEGADYDTLDVDNFGGAVAMTEHLITLGHRDIRMIRGAAGHRDAAEREAGFLATLARFKLPVGEDTVVPGEFTEASGARAAHQILAARKRPTAIFAANDSMAVGAMSAAREAGMNVPEDLAVVGFDDIPIAHYVTPPLTTVRVSIAELGARAAERLLGNIQSNNHNPRKREVLPTGLIIRSSCGAMLSQPTYKEASQ